MEMPKDRTDLYAWVDYFQTTRAEVLEQRGVDIADDVGTMFGWFCNVYMNGYDEARVKQMFDAAGVDNIEDYMETLK